MPQSKLWMECVLSKFTISFVRYLTKIICQNSFFGMIFGSVLLFDGYRCRTYMAIKLNAQMEKQKKKKTKNTKRKMDVLYESSEYMIDFCDECD